LQQGERVRGEIASSKCPFRKQRYAVQAVARRCPEAWAGTSFRKSFWQKFPQKIPQKFPPKIPHKFPQKFLAKVSAKDSATLWEFWYAEDRNRKHYVENI